MNAKKRRNSNKADITRATAAHAKTSARQERETQKVSAAMTAYKPACIHGVPQYRQWVRNVQLSTRGDCLFNCRSLLIIADSMHAGWEIVSELCTWELWPSCGIADWCPPQSIFRIRDFKPAFQNLTFTKPVVNPATKNVTGDTPVNSLWYMICVSHADQQLPPIERKHMIAFSFSPQLNLAYLPAFDRIDDATYSTLSKAFKEPHFIVAISSTGDQRGLPFSEVLDIRAAQGDDKANTAPAGKLARRCEERQLLHAQAAPLLPLQENAVMEGQTQMLIGWKQVARFLREQYKDPRMTDDRVRKMRIPHQGGRPIAVAKKDAEAKYLKFRDNA